MSDISTADSNVIPFDFRGRSVRATSINGEPWFVAADVCKILGQSNTTKALYVLDEDERSNFKLGRQGSVNIINESGLYTLILRCDEAIKRGSDAHAFRKWVTAEVLPAIRKHGQYVDAGNKMTTLVQDVIGVPELNALKGVMSDKAKNVAPEKRISFLHTMHHRLHTRFNVPRTEMIQREHFADACNFVAAYALEGEWLPKQEGIHIEGKRFDRFLVNFDENGKQQITVVPRDACVMTVQQMIKAMLTPGDLPVSTDDMFEFAQAAMTNLQARSDYQTRQLRQMRAAA